MTMRIRNSYRRQTAAATIALAASVAIVSAQTQVTPPANKYSVQEDVKLGQEAAREARRQLPLLRDERVDSYIERLGERLVAAIPADQRHPGFRYTFEVVNVRDINAFALPGGPMFVNRGMIEAAKTEGEVAGVMAHEISHVALRHGTAQASKATQVPDRRRSPARSLGAIIGGTAGQVISQGTQFGLGTAFMRYGREYERQADIEGRADHGARRLRPARHGEHVPDDREAVGRLGGPEWLSDHPNPGNRIGLHHQGSASCCGSAIRSATRPRSSASSRGCGRCRRRRRPKRPRNGRTSSSQGGERGETGRQPDASRQPSSRYTEYDEGGLFRVSVPSNWRELTSNSSVTFAPDGAYGAYNGQNVFTHGVEIGVARNEAHNLREATDELIDSLAESNPAAEARVRVPPAVGGRKERTADGPEQRVGRHAPRGNDPARDDAALDGSLMYAVAVAPDDEFGAYQPHFQRVIQSLRLSAAFRGATPLGLPARSLVRRFAGTPFAGLGLALPRALPHSAPSPPSRASPVPLRSR